MKHPLMKLSQIQKDSIKSLNTHPKIKFEKVSCLNCGSDNHMKLFTNDRYGFNITKIIVFTKKSRLNKLEKKLQLFKKICLKT